MPDEEDFFTPEGVEAYNAATQEYLKQALGYEPPPDAFSQEVEDVVETVSAFVETATDALHAGLTPMAVYSLLRGSLKDVDLEHAHVFLAAFVTHLATELCIQEETDGLSSGSETE